jgi:predicted Mrr-cat superfamily restriction endonuclease
MVDSVQLVKVVTHHKKRLRHPAAELFGKLGVAAVGWNQVGDLTRKTMEDMEAILMAKRQYTKNHAANAAGQLVAWRDRVREKDVIFAYECDNIVAMVGDVMGQYKFDRYNPLGDLDGEFKYPQQIEVKWREKPIFFHRSELPDLSDWLARRGTIALQDYDRSALENMLRRIR